MANIVKGLLALIIMASFASCEKEIPTKINGYFYTTDAPVHEESLVLYVDGVHKGDLPYLNVPLEIADPNDSTFRMRALNVQFMSGKHLFESKTKNGELVCSSLMEFTFTKRKIKSSGYTPQGASGSKTVDSHQTELIWLASKM